MSTYRTWDVKSINEVSCGRSLAIVFYLILSQDSVLVYRQALVAWLSQYKHGSTLFDDIDEEKQANTRATLDGTSHKRLIMDDILCSHKQLNPLTAGNLKRISKVGCSSCSQASI